MNECARCKRKYPTPDMIHKDGVCIVCRHLENQQKENVVPNRVQQHTNN